MRELFFTQEASISRAPAIFEFTKTDSRHPIQVSYRENGMAKTSLHTEEVSTFIPRGACSRVLLKPIRFELINFPVLRIRMEKKVL